MAKNYFTFIYWFLFLFFLSSFFCLCFVFISLLSFFPNRKNDMDKGTRTVRDSHPVWKITRLFLAFLWARQFKISQTGTKLGLSCYKTGSDADEHRENCSVSSFKVTRDKLIDESSCPRTNQFSPPSTNGKEIAFASRKTFRVFAYGQEYAAIAKKKSTLVYWFRRGYILRPWHRSKTLRSIGYEVFRSTSANFAF